MKRSILPAVILMLGVLLMGHAAVFGSEAPGHGFILAETGTIDIIGADTLLFVHEETGARVLHIANNDNNRSVVVAFETPAHCDRGIPHVIEHMIIQGSERFPSPNIFFTLMQQTYNTHVNASVENDFTRFEYASMSEEQVLLMTDFFMDAMFFPLFVTEPLLFMREAWRYEITDADAPLSVTGIVYNEMRGLMSSIESAAEFNLTGTIFQGTVAANNYGGAPEEIINLTHEETVAFHEAYYHPSNMIVFLYGNLDIEPFLEIIGTYCNMFEHRDIFVEKGPDMALTEPVRAVFSFPAEAGAVTDNGSIIYYSINLGRLSPGENVSFDTLAMILGAGPSPLMQNLRAALPGGSFGVTLVNYVTGSLLTVSGGGLNEEDMDVFRDAIHSSVLEIVENGFDSFLVEAIVASFELANLAMADDPKLGTNLAERLAGYNSRGLGLNYLNYLPEGLERIKEAYADGYFEALIEEFILDNPHRALVATVPVAGLAEETDAAFRQVLGERRDRMTDADISLAIENNAAVIEMSNTPAPEEMVESLNAVTVDTLPIEIREFNITERNLGGAGIFAAEAAIGGMYQIDVDFNAAAVPLEELHYLYLYSWLLGQVRTENYELAELQTMMFRYLNEFEVNVDAREFYDLGFHPAFSFGWIGLNGDFPQAAALAAEIIRYTDVTDTDTILSVINRVAFEMRGVINFSPINMLLQRSMAGYYDRSAFINYVTGIDFFAFLSAAADLIENDPETFIANLASARDRLNYLEGSAVFFAGNAEGIEIFEENVELILGHLQEGPVPTADLSDIPRPEGNEGIVLDAAVQFNFFFAGLDDMGIEYSGRFLPLIRILEEGYLTPEIRFNIGAYTTQATINRWGIGMFSFRDPSVAETFAVFEGIADFAAAAELSQADIDRFIISSFAAQTAPSGELSQALGAARNIYLGFPENYRENFLADIKTATLEDLTALAEPLRLAAERGVRIGSGSRGAITANADLFDVIINAFGSTEE